MGVGLGVGRGVGTIVGVGVGAGVRAGVDSGVASGVGKGVGWSVGVGVGVAVGVDAGVGWLAQARANAKTTQHRARMGMVSWMLRRGAELGLLWHWWFGLEGMDGIFRGEVNFGSEWIPA